jgi:hypothetical protein
MSESVHGLTGSEIAFLDGELKHCSDGPQLRFDLVRTALKTLDDNYDLELLKLGGATGIRTPDLLDANESRYQLRHSP